MNEVYKLGLFSIAQVNPTKITIILTGAHIAEFRRNTYYVSGCKQIFKPEGEQTDFTDWQTFSAQLDQRYQISCLQKFTPKWVKRDKADDVWVVSLCDESGVEVWEYPCKISQLPMLGQIVNFSGGAVTVKSFNKFLSTQRMVIYGECQRSSDAA